MKYKDDKRITKIVVSFANMIFFDDIIYHQLKGISWFFLSSVFYTIANILIIVSGNSNIIEISLIRSVTIVVFLTPYFALNPSILIECNWRTIIFVAGGTLGSSIFWYAAIQRIPLSTATAFFSLKSFIIYLLVWKTMGEKVSIKMVIANLICICGAVLMLKPEAAVILGLFLTAVAAVFAAFTSFGIARSAVKVNFMPTFFLASLIQIIALIPFFIREYTSTLESVQINKFNILAVAASGLASLITLSCMAKAFQIAPVNETVASEHLRIPIAMGASAFLSDIPLSLNYIVGCLTILAGLTISLFKRPQRKKPRKYSMKN